jgi:hypothetical protein
MTKVRKSREELNFRKVVMNLIIKRIIGGLKAMSRSLLPTKEMTLREEGEVKFQSEVKTRSRKEKKELGLREEN